MSQGAGVPEAYAASQPGIVMDDDTRPLPLGDYAIESSATVPRPTSSRGTSACGGPFTNRVLGAASHAAINGPSRPDVCAVMPQVVCIGAGGDRLAALRDTGSRIHPPPERRPGGDRGQLAAISAIRHDGVGGMVPPPTPRDAPREPNGRAAALSRYLATLNGEASGSAHRGFVRGCLPAGAGPVSKRGEFPMKPILGSTVALVTGASSGIGAATATALAAQGATVALAARRRDRLDTLAADIREQGGTALVMESDITDERQATDAVERTVAELGRLDTLVNNAGVMLLGPAVGAPLSEWQRMVELNVLGLLYCAHAAIPHLLRAAEDSPRRVADMVNISSVAGRVARNGSGVYNLTKHGVGAFSESLRQEVTKRYVRVSLVEPGATATELAGHNRPEVLESMRNQFGQRMEAEDIADAILYIVTRPRHVAINEMLIRPTEQER